MNQNTYIQYYESKYGSGISDFGPIYYTPRIIQHGRGFGSFFASLFNYLKPLITSGLSAVKDTAIKAGSKALSEVGNRPFKEILIENGVSAANDLEQKYKKKFQGGQGFLAARKNAIKSKYHPKINHSTSKTRSVKTKRKTLRKKSKRISKIKERVLDIFSKRK